MKILYSFFQNIDHFFSMIDSAKHYASGDLRLFSNFELMFGHIVNFFARFLFDLLN